MNFRFGHSRSRSWTFSLRSRGSQMLRRDAILLTTFRYLSSSWRVFLRVVPIFYDGWEPPYSQDACYLGVDDKVIGADLSGRRALVEQAIADSEKANQGGRPTACAENAQNVVWQGGGPQYVVGPPVSGLAQWLGVLPSSFELSSLRAVDSWWLIVEGWAMQCTDGESGWSLTVWFRISKRHTRRVKSGMMKSAKIELCVTCHFSLNWKFKDRTNPRKTDRGIDPHAV